MRKFLPALLAIIALAPAARAAELPPRIVMMWQVTGRDYAGDFDELKRMGVNVAQSFALAGMDPAYIAGYFRAAGAAGIGVVPFLGSFVTGSGDDCALSAAGEDFVRAHAKEPALLAWHSVDEPVNHGITKSCQLRLYRQLKGIDPDHPVLVSINFTKQSEYDGYFEERAFDLLDLHRYVNPDVGPAQERLIDVFRQNRTRNYRVIVTLRGFDAPAKERRQAMRSGSLDSQYAYFFGKNRVGDDVGFYGWRLAPNLGISQIDWLKSEFGRLAREKLAAPPHD